MLHSVYSEQNTQEVSIYKGTRVGLSFGIHMVYGSSGVPCSMVRQFPTSDSRFGCWYIVVMVFRR
jgi:hypothetical protein